MLRVAALVLLILLPAWSGCLGGDAEGGDRLAQPTDRPIVVPTRTPTRAPTGPVANLSDPGYVVTAPWRVGDGWDYVSNQSHERRVRVVDQRFSGGVTVFVVETTQLKSTGEVQSVTRAWVDSKEWRMLNRTDELGATDRYQPGVPLRQYKNASAPYNHTRTDVGGNIMGSASTVLYSRLFPSHQTLQFPWGYVEAKRVEELTVSRATNGERAEQTVTRWVHKDYLNDVQFTLPGGETYKLTAVKAGEFRRGELAS